MLADLGAAVHDMLNGSPNTSLTELNIEEVILDADVGSIDERVTVTFKKVGLTNQHFNVQAHENDILNGVDLIARRHLRVGRDSDGIRRFSLQAFVSIDKNSWNSVISRGIGADALLTQVPTLH